MNHLQVLLVIEREVVGVLMQLMMRVVMDVKMDEHLVLLVELHGGAGTDRSLAVNRGKHEMKDQVLLKLTFKILNGNRKLLSYQPGSKLPHS